MPALRRKTLADLDPRVNIPRFDADDVAPAIVHIGVGGFHRAHQAVYLDDLLGNGDRSWGITGVGLLPHDTAMHDALTAQDHLYTVVTKQADGSLTPRVIGSIVDYLFAPDDPDRVVALLSSPSTRIVSLTITEGGYHVEQATGRVVIDDALRADLTGHTTARTAVGLLVRSLAARRAAGTPPFTVVSCDNIAGNGDLARRTVSTAAQVIDHELSEWIRTSVEFPNSMVDRITPVTSDADRDRLVQEFGVVDRWPVVCEPYIQWVLEDRFSNGRPALENVGVQLVDDVGPYESMKLRLLNAGHQAIGFLGYLAGHRYTHEAAQDPLFAEFLLGYLTEEATPTLGPLPGIDLDHYQRTLIARFANPHVRDTLSRLCADTSNRIPTFLLPVIRDQLAAGGELRRSALVVAAWARYAAGIDEQGEPITVVDHRSTELTAAARRFDDDPLAFLRVRGVFGDLVDSVRFTEAYADSLDSLWRLGAAATTAELTARLSDLR
ncbi:MAG: mannitol dehydrogenase family protein [Gordonia sp. (in: high G+C Gram-positive bacteria)]